MNLNFSLLNVEVDLETTWYTVSFDLMSLEVGDWSGSLLYIGWILDHFEFDLFYMRFLYYKIFGKGQGD